MTQRPIPYEARQEADGARTLTLVANVLFGIIGAIFVLIGLAVTLAGPLGLFFLAFGVVPLVFLVLVHLLVYGPLGEDRYEEAVTPALVLGILSLLVGGGLPGIFLLVVYAKAKAADSMVRMAGRLLAETPRPPPAPGGPEAGPAAAPSPEPAPEAAETPRLCPSCGWELAPAVRFCTNCGRPVP